MKEVYEPAGGSEKEDASGREGRVLELEFNAGRQEDRAV